MFFSKKEEMNENLDRAGSEVCRAAGLSELETDAAASAPFLYARVRARIERERQRSAENVPAIAMLSHAWRAVPALAMVAVAAVSVFWLTTPAATGGVQPAPVQSDNIKLIATGGTCALSSAGECAISSEEVLATMFREEEKVEK